MRFIDIEEAQLNLFKLVKRVEAGEEIVISKAGKPLARLEAYRETSKVPKRKPDSLKGKIWISEDFDKRDPEIEKLFGELD